MKPSLAGALALALPVAWGVPNSTALADPIHARSNGDYWHHDSGWIFPERVAGFLRIGFPQDVAGSHDAVGHYECVTNGVRWVIDVDLFADDSAAEGITWAQTRASLTPVAKISASELREDTMELGPGRLATRVRYTPASGAPGMTWYFIAAGDWRVRIRATVPASSGEVASQLDDFVRLQQWDQLPR